MKAAQQPLLAFFRGTGVDQSGRHLDDVLAFDDVHLEQIHDYIQWLFPLSQHSHYNPQAPVLDRGQIDLFRADDDLKRAVLKGLDRMLSFYGLERVSDRPEDVIRRAKQFERRKREWLNDNNNNFKRITRILTSLRLLGLEKHSAALYACLRDI